MVIVHGITFAITWLQRLHGLNHLSDLTALENLYEVCLSSAMDDKLNPGISTVKQKGINIQTSCHYSILLCGGRCLWFWILIPLWVFFFFLLRVFYTIMWFLILHTLLFKPHFFCFCYYFTSLRLSSSLCYRGKIRPFYTSSCSFPIFFSLVFFGTSSQ